MKKIISQKEITKQIKGYSKKQINEYMYAFMKKKRNNDIEELITKYNNSINNIQKKYNQNKTPTLGVKLQKFKRARNTLKKKKLNFTEFEADHMKNNKSLNNVADYINTLTR